MFSNSMKKKWKGWSPEKGKKKEVQRKDKLKKHLDLKVN